MPSVTPERITRVVLLLWEGVYEANFRGKSRGRFVITREQLKLALNVDRLHASTVQALQDAALQQGLVIMDLDDLFPCVETKVVRKYRRPPSTIFTQLVTTYLGDGDGTTPDDNEEESDDDE